MKHKTRFCILRNTRIFLILISGSIMFSSCHKDNDDNTPGTVADYDNNIYQTVKIGTQTWMTENLKVTHYNDGEQIPNVTDNTEWVNLTTDAYCWYNNDETTHKNTYGALYNWYAVETGKLCPNGWHVPTEAEWNKLIDYMGGQSIAGGKMKETGTTHWNDPNTGATDEYGFKALPGGNRINSGLYFDEMGRYSYMWSSTAYDEGTAMEHHIFYNTANIEGYHSDKESGFSVRCIKD